LNKIVSVEISEIECKKIHQFIKKSESVLKTTPL